LRPREDRQRLEGLPEVRETLDAVRGAYNLVIRLYHEVEAYGDVGRTVASAAACPPPRKEVGMRMRRTRRPSHDASTSSVPAITPESLHDQGVDPVRGAYSTGGGPRAAGDQLGGSN
jgi:hypothetical protein